MTDEISKKQDELFDLIEKEIIDELEFLEPGYGMTKKGLNKRLKIDMDLLTLVLKRMKYNQIIELIMLWDEHDCKPDGSGYCLTYKLDER